MLTIRINDMTCGGCAGRVERAIAAADSNAQMEFSIPQRIVRVATDLAAPVLLGAIRDAGYTPENVEEPAA